MKPKVEECPCAICKNNIGFDLDDFLLDEVLKQNVAIFAGAGVSTETDSASPHSLFTELEHHLNLNNSELPFPDLAQAVADKPDGRFKLLKIVQARFDYISKFHDLRVVATKFYRELATMPYFNTFITTNWDRNFEELCSAKPFVYDTDMRFWELPARKVLKLHGTIDDYSSIVATRSDYDECEERLHKSLMGAKLKDILTTQTCLFMGYSLRDDDIKEIFSFVRDSLGKFPKAHYFISPHDPVEALPEQIIHIKTDATFFLSTLKSHMCNTACYLADEVYDFVEEELEGLIVDHLELFDQFDVSEHPQVIITGAYQDGLIHGYQMIIDSRTSGKYSDLHAVQSVAAQYEDKLAFYRKIKQFEDVAYFRGYQNAMIGMVYAGANEDELFFAPRYYFEKIGELDKDNYNDVFIELPSIHKGAFARCQKIMKKWNLKKGMVIQHMPWG